MSTRLTYIFAAALIAVSCAEFEPVFTGKYPDPPVYSETEKAFDPSVIPSDKLVTISELAARFKEEAAAAGVNDFDPWGWVVSDELWVKGRITSSDRSGNFYKSFYIQDDPEGPGIEVKIGKNSLYNEYKLGQEIYINLDGLCVGEYGWKSGDSYGEGMVQIGLADPSETYSTAYLEHQYIIEKHIFRGGPDDIRIIPPRVVSVDDLPQMKSFLSYGKTKWNLVNPDTQADNPCIGSLITLENLEYANEIFALLYVRGTESNKNSSNRVFLSDKSWGVDTWAISKTGFVNHLNAGDWDTATVGNSNDNLGTVVDVKDELLNNANAYSVSQYFKLPNGCFVQVRSSGFSKFADLQMSKSAGWNNGKITVSGILTIYQGTFQLVLTD
ncbi:MAG: DUF5689 domain-containing protein, partial [Candidatus Cryptobacteroides sp.]